MSDVRLYEGVEIHTGTCSNCGHGLRQKVGVYRDGTTGKGGRVIHVLEHDRVGTYGCPLFASGDLTLESTYWFGENE